LLNQSKLVGVLYLENQLAAGAFTPERTQVLHLLSTQSAIAIENAKLYSKLRASESLMAQFLEAVPVGIGIVDAAGRPYYANQRGIQLIGKGIDPAVPPDQLAEVYQLYLAGTDRNYPTENMPIVRALSGDCTTVDDIEIHQNNAITPIEVWGTPIFDERGKVAYAIAAFQDITERKQTEHLMANYNRTLAQQVAERTDALQASETELRALFAAIPDPLFVLTGEGRVIEAVEVGTGQLYKPIEEQVGKTLHEIFSQAQADEFLDYIHQVLSTQQMLTVEYSLLMAGKKTWFSTRIAPIRPGQVIWLARDITDRKLAEAASILEERNRIAREIHDTLAQAFTGILLHIGAATEQITNNPERAQTHMETIDELARAGLAEARRSVTTLRPKLLEEGDLYRALSHLTAQMKSSTNTHITCEIIGGIYALSPDVENNLLRIGQEALTNAIKYAHATLIQVELIYEETQSLLKIKDDGQGFEVDQVYPTKGFGLLGMSERVEQIGGELIIRSQPDHGTEVIVIVNRE
ncbi:MAG: PAS domain-containing protein, partial [Chroococcidiopsis sp.]